MGTDPQNLGPIADYEVKTLASVKTVKMWKKECICLKDSEQEIKPSSEEKIKLAKIGLGLHKLVFEANGNAEHVHNTILDKFPVLEYCGGYSLLQLASNSHNFIEIDSPEGGTTVPFLRDVLNQAKLYIRPLQHTIDEEDMKKYSTCKVGG